MKKVSVKFGAVVMGLAAVIAAEAQAASCRVIHWKPDSVLTINSALVLGTRIEFPSDLLFDPVTSSTLWDAEGQATQVVVKPNSTEDLGKSAVVRVFTNDGNAYDVLASRAPAGSTGDVCVKVVADGMFFTPGARSAMTAQSGRMAQGAAAMGMQVQQTQQQLVQVRRQAEDDKKKAVMEALRRFRYHVYTRYTWSEGKGFSAKGIVTDVYDDGRFTYIRLDKPNRGLLSVETEVGGKNAVVPTKYDDAYGMYVISGIYSKFTLKQDEAEIKIARADNSTNGEF